MEKILLIEDEANIRKVIAYELRQANYEVIECEDGESALAIGLKDHFDLMIIDWMLPKISGIELLERFKNEGLDSIIMMLTARDEEYDILHAFELGADDYVTKPFSPRQLRARVNAHLKRVIKSDVANLSIGSVKMDLARRVAKISDVALELTKKEFDLLEFFIKNRGIVLSRDNILNSIWGFDYDGDTRIVDVHVFKLRTKLSKSDVSIKSSRGIGYLMDTTNE
ncbi:MAG: response regulator transcription factor [Erysipelotrichaceae bacterium]